MNNHPQHRRHPTMRLKRNGSNPFECSGCKEQGFGPRYQCEATNCPFILHEICFKARPTDRSKPHPFMADCGFKFFWISPGDPNRQFCHACERQVRGFLYRTLVQSGPPRRSSRWLYLHPSCMKLERTICDPSNKIKLILKDTIPSNSECVECRRPFSSSGWSYVSSCENYCFHTYCVNSLILDKWERDYFNVGSSSYSSSSSSSSSSSLSSTEKSSVQDENANLSSRIMNEQSDRSLISSAKSSFALPFRPLWKPRISPATRDELIRLVKIFFSVMIASRYGGKDPIGMFNAIADRVLDEKKVDDKKEKNKKQLVSDGILFHH